MKITIAGQEIKLSSLLVGFLFFLISIVVFFLYAIDFSVLALSLVLIFYAQYLKKDNELPSALDLSILAASAILLAIFTDINLKTSGYGIPAIGFAILVTLLFNNLEFSFLFAAFVAYLGASVDGGNFNVGVSLFAASLIASVLSFRVRRRFQVIKAGFLAGIVQFVIALFVEKKLNLFIFSASDFNLFEICALNGLISAFAVLGVLPVFEYIFKVVTNISLLELSDFNHPLLRRLILEAPGTYQHSLVVANLSEQAAEAIGANSLLARVGSYYHDIGKMNKPNYFIENQIAYNDAHKDLKPSMSRLIIMNHVKDGVELATKHKINPKIIDFILQHHGKTLVFFFYQRAKELEPETEHEEDYRYPGPKPQSKEIAIVSLADTIEALSRVLEEPTPSRIEEMVREVVKKRFMDGELDESGLTLKELEKITQKFAHILNAFFHTRINYTKDESR